MKNLKSVLVLMLALATTIGFANLAKAGTCCPCQAKTQPTYKVAVVFVAEVLASSSQVKALKAEQQAKLNELEIWLATAKADVEKQSTKEGQDKLIKKYEATFAKKQEAIKANYEKKLAAIEINVATAIEQVRVEKGYDIVLARGIVLAGGDDITAEVSKRVK